MQGILSWQGLLLSGVMVTLAGPAPAAQVDLHGPPGSESFGSHVAVLPNGNIVVTDPLYSTPTVSHVGAVHLFDPQGNPISMLTGSQADDHVGTGRIVVLANGHFVAFSRDWDNGDAIDAGAVTWINGDMGLSGTVSAQNSLVGHSTYDAIGGYEGVTALPNGHYVVVSDSWDNGGANNAGAVTWGNGNGGTVGAVSPANSLVGTEAMDSVGNDQDWFSNIAILPNGNYVVTSWYWHHDSRTNAGAVTWGNGEGGTVGPVSASNSLLGTTDCSSDTGAYSQITVLTNGNYVVSSPCWDNGSIADVGASTWVDGTQPFGGEVSGDNSLVGTHNWDRVGGGRATALSNGNYVVNSSTWLGGTGAATWGDGTTGQPTGAISGANSLIGSAAGTYASHAYALSNGHYVVANSRWHNAADLRVGAVTWGNGHVGTIGVISESNSLVGSTDGDVIGFRGIAALPNGNYVVISPYWSSDSSEYAGAVTMLDGNGPMSAVVTADNSLTGSQANDLVGDHGIRVLPNGSFVIASPYWNLGSAFNAGAVTWADGVTPLSGTVSAANSLVGSHAEDRVGDRPALLLANGHYVISSYQWDLANLANAGAVTWGNANGGTVGAVSADNSLVGTFANDQLRIYGQTLVDGNFLVARNSDGGDPNLESLSIINGNYASSGPPQAWNTVVANIDYDSWSQETAYDATRTRLVVGQPSSNKVILFRVDDALFANGFD